MQVWVLEIGHWDERMVRGVFASPELAMAFWPRGVWKQDEFGWSNDLDWGDHAELYVFEVVTASLDPVDGDLTNSDFGI